MKPPVRTTFKIIHFIILIDQILIDTSSCNASTIIIKLHRSLYVGAYDSSLFKI